MESNALGILSFSALKLLNEAFTINYRLHHLLELLKPLWQKVAVHQQNPLTTRKARFQVTFSNWALALAKSDKLESLSHVFTLG